jgi:endonuclease YncB( thermonuclease family)
MRAPSQRTPDRRLCILAIGLLWVTLTYTAMGGAPPWRGKCVEVTAGDTLIVTHSGPPETVRLAGIASPKLLQAYGAEARQLTAGLVLWQNVVVYPESTDQSGRTVGWVFLGQTKVNLEIVKAGAAWWDRNGAPTNKALQEAEKTARDAHKGLWADKAPLPPWDYQAGQLPTVGFPVPSVSSFVPSLGDVSSRSCVAPGEVGGSGTGTWGQPQGSAQYGGYGGYSGYGGSSGYGKWGPLTDEPGYGYGQISDVTGRERTDYVHGYYRKDGTHVHAYYRSHR